MAVYGNSPEERELAADEMGRRGGGGGRGGGFRGGRGGRWGGRHRRFGGRGRGWGYYPYQLPLDYYDDEPYDEMDEALMRVALRNQLRKRERLILGEDEFDSLGDEPTVGAVVIVEEKWKLLPFGPKEFNATIYRVSKGLTGWGLTKGETYTHGDPFAAGDIARSHAVKNGLNYLGAIYYKLPVPKATVAITPSRSSGAAPKKLPAKKRITLPAKKRITLPPIEIKADAPFVKLVILQTYE